MTTQTHHEHWAHRLGRGAGRAWRWLARRDQQLTRTLMARGLSVRFARTVLWVVKIVVLGALLYMAFWLTLLFVLVIVAVWMTRNQDGDNEVEGSSLGDSADHKRNPFYDPINYNDTPDPRFSDDD
ncbi:MAG TPA: DUF3742 family protein [Rhodanobacter sp.]|nr:DUF3742 family protein [Rhodanobacter sp.]